MIARRPTLLIAALVSLTLGACSSGTDGTVSQGTAATSSTGADANVPTTGTAPDVTINTAKTYTATLDTSEGKIVIALDAKTAPKSVNQFVTLANERFFDGLTFHRASRNFVIQGGDPNGDGTGGPGYGNVVEVPADGYKVGSVAWAKAGSEPPGTAGSQFFIVTSDGPSLEQGLNVKPYEYGIIGTVTEGLDVAKKIEGLAPTSGDGPPNRKVTIKKVTIATES